jgi:adenine-specific DNA methylase
MTYTKRLIEVDLPIKRISAHARREKSIRHGHISTLHIWWARRPLAACRAVICAALWPDPADPNCPAAFREAAARLILDFARKVTGDTKLANDHCSPENFKLWQRLAGGAGFQPAARPQETQDAGWKPAPPLALRGALLDFIADFSNWDNSTVEEYLDTSRALTQAAHEALGGAPGTRPLVVDPFCGGGSIPLEALRVGFQIIVKQRGGWVNQSEPKTKIEDPNFDGTVKRGSATCPCCGYTTPVGRVREQLKKRRGGACDARLVCIVTTRPREQGRVYRLATEIDVTASCKTSAELRKQWKAHTGLLSLVPDEKLDPRGIRHTWAMIYGLEQWGDLFMPRQALVLTTLFKLLDDVERKANDSGLSLALRVSLALAIDRQANASTSLSRWHTSRENLEGLFARQAIPMIWDYAESAPFCDSTGGFDGAVEWVAKVCEANVLGTAAGQAEAASAVSHPLADDSAHAFITDPPYYDAVPYAYLSDFFYVWLRRCLFRDLPDLFAHASVPKDAEIVVDRPHELSNSTHDIAFYERELTKAFAEGRRILRPDGVGTVVFASKTTASWEAILKAVVDAGWIITGSWPIDTEMEARVSAQGQARLASSVHLVCRPRENPDRSVRTNEVGDWRGVLSELPRRIHEWMPRLAEEGVVGADAIFACLGPALEIFSRYSRVEKASGEAVTLKEYLEQVWAAVAKEALTMIFTGADTTAFEEDARLTAMWLWTLKTGDANGAEAEAGDEGPREDEEAGGKKGGAGGFVLEFDAARKIAQGLGAHLEDLATLVAVEGETARLLPVAERARPLVGKDEGKATPIRRKRGPQMELFKAAQEGNDGKPTFGEAKVEKVGTTVLDRVHQSMILFAAGRSDALKRFLVEDAAGNDTRFWTLAQALSALYPSNTDEKRWVDGVLARKKGLGF